MILRRSDAFENDFARLPEHILGRVEKALRLLAENPRHPSLRVKKMRGTTGIREARVSLEYSITFAWQGQVLTLRRIGTHDILRKES
jgi:mRNA-degrading endonuclease YafQ of YafQ-DinJ toxin-antitoxin module